jgi:hypothetical protein
MPRPIAYNARWLGISGLTQAECCRRRDLPLHTFRRHRYRRRST